MSSEGLLGIWTALGIAWWLLSWRLVAAEAEARPDPPGSGTDLETLSIFKPLAPLGIQGLGETAEGLESFVAQLDGRSELLLGLHEQDRVATAALVADLRARYPQARLKVIFRTASDDVPNPKIAWQKQLAPHAEGELWLWSDADIVAPPGFLRRLRRELADTGATLLTFPYVVRRIASRPAILDALYVNAEFYPGVLGLRRCGPVDFGLGAGMLFRRNDFLARIDWHELGHSLADDFVLGQNLQPVRLSETTLVTAADVSTWKAALLHYWRWSKTVWWNRPFGCAARLVVLPVVGWLFHLAFHLTSLRAWLELAGMMQVDVAFAALLCREAGCPWGVRDLLATEAWSLGRAGIWLACWLPWPVRWSGKTWRGPRMSGEMRDDKLG